MVFAKRNLAASVRFDEQPDGIYDKYLVCVTSSRTSDSYRLQNSCRPQGCRGYGDLHGYGYVAGMGMIFHPQRPMGILWGFLINLK